MGILLTSCKNEEKNKTISETELNAEIDKEMDKEMETSNATLEIESISHATAIIKWGDAVIYTDPVGGAKSFEGKAAPSFILITDIHGDHMDVKHWKLLIWVIQKLLFHKLLKINYQKRWTLI